MYAWLTFLPRQLKGGGGGGGKRYNHCGNEVGRL